MLAKGAAKFNVNVDTLQLIGGFSNNVFECSRKGEAIILKFYPSSTYKKETILAELDWICFLHTSGVNVTKPLHSVHGELFEVIPSDQEECYVLAFEKAKGTFIDTSDTKSWNKALFYTFGKTLGNIHFLSKQYKPSQIHHWNEGLLFSKTLDHVCEDVIAKWEWFLSELQQLPKDNNGYGMIHHDLHHKNFYVHNNELVLFDFGDCEHNWFMYDIAIVLYHAVQTVDENDREGRKDFAIRFMTSFLQGYLQENDLDRHWLTKLPFFLNYRQTYSYIYFETFLPEDQKNNEKVKQILDSMREKIVSDTPYLNLSFDQDIQLR